MNNSYSPFLLMLASILLWSCQNEPQNQRQMQTPNLPVVKLQQKDITTYKSYPTTLEGEISSDIRAKVSGYVTNVLVEEWKEVKKDQILLKNLFC